ncbi:hypothetical protein BVRB_5g112950 isoform B [Beta vulgaris subsp. vulgaris]|uniref:uncharacterized protein LOC104893857 n=1 Tax=Beta vulgaris subsp. vulgaris TaxID=3555 RepID=UPI00053F8464|nr:uncharacterized protein LOC104893857 [Beta vulgaris subsp. vulgaris]KMT10963.1 hypothetical protein BVRB_5g112950 isoform B [Beta vulgaris subsp. vulgaris]
MGCGGSKLGPEQEARLRPILRRRLEEFIARRNAGLSKKQLLAADGAVSRDSEGEDNEEEITKDDTPPPPPPPPMPPPVSPPHGLNNDHVFLRTQDIPPVPQIITPTIDNNTINNDELVSGNYVKGENTHVGEEKISNDIDTSKGSLQGEEDECVDNLDNLDIYGSPSFRVYCVQSLDEELEDIAGHLESEECINEVDKNGLRRESSDSNEVMVEKHTLKKNRRGRKFKRIMIPKRGKNIFHNMPSFYNFPCNSNNSHLMEQAAA